MLPLRGGAFVTGWVAMAAMLGALALADTLFPPAFEGAVGNTEAPAPAALGPGAAGTASLPRPDTRPPPEPSAVTPAAQPVQATAPAPDLPFRIAALARQVEAGEARAAGELAALLDECAAAPHLMAVWACDTAGAECEAQNARAARYGEIAHACRSVPYEVREKRQQYRDLAALAH